MQIIRLTPEDDIIALCDFLDWAKDQQVLFVLSTDKGVHDGIDLVRLRRHADRLRIEIGLVVTDREFVRQARALGIPTFATVEKARRNRRGWWRGRRRQESVGVPTIGGVQLSDWREDVTETNGRYQWESLVKPASRTQWLWRYLLILLFFVAAALLYVGFIYAVPSATITLKPVLAAVQATQPITADPTLTAVDLTNKTIPARLLTVTQSWEAEIEATGEVEQPTTPAQGRVLFTNLTEEEIIVPAGTPISTEDQRHIFETIGDVYVAGAEGSTAEVAVASTVPGPQANVAADTVVRLLDGELVDQLEVRNPEPMAGGAVRTVTAVAQRDLDRLQSQVLQFLQAVALADMDAQLTEREFLPRESLQLVEILAEDYSHEVGEQTNRVSLRMEAVLRATAVNTVESAPLVYEALADQVPANHTLVPDSFTFERGEILAIDNEGRVTFVMIAEGQAAADLMLDDTLEAISGQSTAVAISYLYEQLPLRAVPDVKVSPLWHNHIPYLSTRIQINQEVTE